MKGSFTASPPPLWFSSLFFIFILFFFFFLPQRKFDSFFQIPLPPPLYPLYDKKDFMAIATGHCSILKYQLWVYLLESLRSGGPIHQMILRLEASAPLLFKPFFLLFIPPQSSLIQLITRSFQASYLQGTSVCIIFLCMNPRGSDMHT